MEHQPSFLKKKAWGISLLAASTVLSSFSQTALNQNMTSSVPLQSNHSETTTQKIRAYGPSLVKISPWGDITRPLGSYLTLTCSADSVPLPHYSWFFNNISRNVTGDHFTINATSLEDQGVYECCAYNSETNMTARASVFVRITTDQETSLALSELILKVVVGISVGLILVVMILTGILLCRFCPKLRGENSQPTTSTSTIYDDASPALHGTKPGTLAGLPSNPYQTLQHGDEAVYEDPQK